MPPDDELWERLRKQIRPLKPSLAHDGKAKHTPKHRSGLPAEGDRAGTEPKAAQDLGDKEAAKARLVSHGQKASGNNEVDKSTLRRLQRGQMKIEALLDLHGMTRTKAHDALLRFIDMAGRKGLRTVLVITGKGRKTDSENFLRPEGAIRRAFQEWVRETPLSDVILRCEPARPMHGGEGAFYVYLRNISKIN